MTIHTTQRNIVERVSVGKLFFIGLPVVYQVVLNACVRYEMEETGKSHADNMLPDGSVDDGLQGMFEKDERTL